MSVGKIRERAFLKVRRHRSRPLPGHIHAEKRPGPGGFRFTEMHRQLVLCRRCTSGGDDDAGSSDSSVLAVPLHAKQAAEYVI